MFECVGNSFLSGALITQVKEELYWKRLRKKKKLSKEM